MTPFPYAVQSDEDVAVARALMEEHGIHHLPVLRDGVPAGMVSMRDIGLALSVASHATAPLPVWAVCTRDPYVVEVDVRADLVITQMAELGIGSAIVMRHRKLAGIITQTDVCRAYVNLLRAQAGITPDDDVVA